jgi:hypothetical protein
MNSALPLPPAEYEPRDGSVRAIVWTGVGLAAAIGIVLMIAALVYLADERSRPTPDEFGRQTSFRNSAKAETDIQADWARQDAAVHQHLETYGWVDRAAGTVRIPIDRAMQLIVDEDSPARKDANP